VAAVPATWTRRLRKKKLVVATNTWVSRAWLKKQGYDYRIVDLRRHRVFPPDDADMIVDNTATGRTLQDNGLRIVDTLLESSTRFVAPSALPIPKRANA
jgi:ATP phosphoribosyltransferase